MSPQIARNRLRFLYSLATINILLLLYFWISGNRFLFSSAGGTFLAFAKLAGLILAQCVLLQFLLIGRVRFLEEAVGLDKLARIHHTNGKVILFLVILHPITIVWSYMITSHSNLWDQLYDFLTHYTEIPKAVLAQILFITIVIISLSIVRKRLKYEAWYYVHVMLYGAVLLAFSHQITYGGTLIASKLAMYYWYALYIGVLGIFFTYRWVRPLYLYIKYGFFIKDIQKETSNITTLIISGKNIQNFPRKSGQFMILRFINKFWWQAHPFSLSWGENNTDLRVSIKNSGDFTAMIPTFKKGTKIEIDGMYGTFTKDFARKNKFLFIVGGIGITPVRSLMETIGIEGKNMILLYASKTHADIAFEDEITAMQKIYQLKVVYFLSEEKGKKKPQVEYKRIDNLAIKTHVKDIKERDVYLCGPTKFIEAMLEALKNEGVSKENIHFEKFSLH
jgi:predicted ferric reductase